MEKFLYAKSGLRRGTPLQHTLIFCQFVESDPKGLGLKYLAS